ncbi:MAG: hypothetical protein ACRDT0_24115 [Pseudonocardiaceae bacterium]
MGTISPVVADAFRLLRTDLYSHLDEADSLADRCDEWSDQDVDTVRELIPDLVLVIRGLLIEHKVQASGDCRICTSAWPCPVVTRIHALVKDPENQFVELVRRARDDD